MSTILDFQNDVKGANAYAPQFAIDKFSASLLANVNQHITVPSNFQNWVAVFAYELGSNVWVCNNASAAIPAGAFSATNSDLNPGARLVKAGDVIDFVTDAVEADVWVALYAIS